MQRNDLHRLGVMAVYEAVSACDGLPSRGVCVLVRRRPYVMNQTHGSELG